MKPLSNPKSATPRRPSGRFIPGGIAPGGIAPGGIAPGGIAPGGIAPGGIAPILLLALSLWPGWHAATAAEDSLRELLPASSGLATDVVPPNVVTPNVVASKLLATTGTAAGGAAVARVAAATAPGGPAAVNSSADSALNPASSTSPVTRPNAGSGGGASAGSNSNPASGSSTSGSGGTSPVGDTTSGPGAVTAAGGGTTGGGLPSGATGSSTTGAGAPNGTASPGASGSVTASGTAQTATSSGVSKLPPPLPVAIQSMLLLDDMAHARVLTSTPDTLKLPAEVRQTLYDALDFRVDLETESGFYTVLSLRWMGSWAIATVTAMDVTRSMETGGHHLAPDELMNLLLVSTPQGWEAALEDDPYVQALLTWIPLKELPEEARAVLFSNAAVPTPARRTLGMRLGARGKNGMDPATPRPEGAALAATLPSENRSLATRPVAGLSSGNLSSGNLLGSSAGASSGVGLATTPPNQTQANAGRLGRLELERAMILPAQPEITAPGSGTIAYVCNDGTFSALLLSSSEVPRQWLLTGVDPASLSLYGVGIGSVVNEGQRLGDAVATGNGILETACSQLHTPGGSP